MSSTSTTQYYGLTQYVGTDKPDFADNNVAFRDVDAALHGVVQDAEGFATDITNLQTDVAATQSDITTLQTDLDTAEANIVTINNKDLAQDAEIARVDTNSKDMITAYNEASATSTHAYAIGDYFIYNNVLYKATAAIAIGDTIVPDTNCSTTNVGAELIKLNSDLNEKVVYNNQQVSTNASGVAVFTVPSGYTPIIVTDSTAGADSICSIYYSRTGSTWCAKLVSAINDSVIASSTRNLSIIFAKPILLQ